MTLRQIVMIASVVGFVGVPALAWTCSVSSIASPQTLVRDAEVIVRVRADGLSGTPGREQTFGSSRTQVQFTVLDILKGTLPSQTLEFNGTLADADDRNDQPVPYDFVRPGGRRGNCVALEYRVGGEYLLMLRRPQRPSSSQPDDLTPYWSALAPTNEQLFGGATDAWLLWVREELRKRPTPQAAIRHALVARSRWSWRIATIAG